MQDASDATDEVKLFLDEEEVFLVNELDKYARKEPVVIRLLSQLSNMGLNPADFFNLMFGSDAKALELSRKLSAVRHIKKTLGFDENIENEGEN